MFSDNLNITALAVYGGSKILDAVVGAFGRVQFELDLSPEAHELLEQARRGGLQVDYLRYVAAQEEVRGVLRRAKARSASGNGGR